MADFATTRWSLVLNAGSGSEESAARALEQLCQIYRYPIYLFSRRLNDSHEDAEDITQSFFAELVQKNLIAKARPEKGRFRSFLLTSFRRHRSKYREYLRARKRGGHAMILSLDDRSSEDPVMGGALDTALTPEEHFERAWALTVLNQAHRRLASEYSEAGKERLFERLRPLLESTGDESGYAVIAADVGKTEAAIKMEVSRMRKRLGTLLRLVVRDTVDEAHEADDELHYLVTLLKK